jgi:hypothetical protein
MTQDNEAFLERWSRLKCEQPPEGAPAAPGSQRGQPPAKSEQDAPVPVLPPVDQLKPESDFTPFMNPKVADGTRRLALKKLFTDAHFNIPEAYEPYSADFTQGEPIPAKILKAINRVRDVAVKGEEKVVEDERLAEAARAEAENAETAAAEAPTQEPDDVAGKQDA